MQGSLAGGRALLGFRENILPNERENGNDNLGRRLCRRREDRRALS